MKPLIRLIGIVVLGMVVATVFASPTSFAQKRRYDLIMQDIQSTFGSLRKNLDAKAAATAAQDASKLESLFKETEAFWAPFKTKDALDAAKGAQQASAAVAAAAKNNDLQKAQASYAAVGKYCGGCHNSHREQMPDKSYRIKP